jgi:hypothetical protein
MSSYPRKLPVQPIYVDKYEVARFRPNKIVEFLLKEVEKQGITLNTLAHPNYGFTEAEYDQFAQLIGYSLCGASDLSYVADRTIKKGNKYLKKLIALDGWNDEKLSIEE